MNKTFKAWYDRRVSLGCKTETWRSPKGWWPWYTWPIRGLWQTRTIKVAWDLTDCWGLAFERNFNDEPWIVSLERLLDAGWYKVSDGLEPTAN